MLETRPSIETTRASPNVMPLDIQNWGRIPYLEAWNQQKNLLDKRIKDEIPDTLIFCEHEPVITLGRGALRADSPQVYSTKIPVLEIERGGLATYHGPGQLVIYPILQLAKKESGSNTPYAKRGVHNLIRSLELWTITWLQSHDLNAGVVEGKTGVWIDGTRKIASIGIAARHWVSYHGIAINLNTGSEVWNALSPCGFSASVMTDFQMETKKTLSAEHASGELIQHLNTLFAQ
jgi:lipoyl(octanoyl) transferase